VSDHALFVPPAPADPALPPSTQGLFQSRSFVRLFAAQVVSSAGDWIGLVAILAMAARVSDSGAAIGLVMTARMLPGFLLAPVAGAFVDRWDRRKVMVSCDLGRAGLLALLPLFDTLPGLVLISFLLEMLTIMWGPAKDASVPNVVAADQLAAANSLGLLAAFGTFPLGAVLFAALAGVAKWLGGFDAFDVLAFDQERLAIWFDSLTFVASAVLIFGLRLPGNGRHDDTKVDLTQTFRDIADGLRFIRGHALVRGVMIGLAGGLLGGGAIVPLGPVFSKQVLGAGSAGFGLLMTALGVGAAVGVATLVWLQRRLPRPQVFVGCVVGCGVSICVVAATSRLGVAALCVVLVGATAGSAYVTGFTVLQESVADELRGRTFATLYTIVRVCLLLSLTLGPFTASLLGQASEALVGGQVSVGGVEIALTGVRLALWMGGVMTILAGVMAARRMRRDAALVASGQAAP